MTRMVKRSKRKTMITTGPSQGIGGGITNAFLDPRLQRRCVGNGLAHDLRIRANSEEDLTAASIQKSTRLSPPRDNWPVDRLNSTVSTRRQAPERAHRFRSSL